ncbi:MAG: class I tRNA ligase family protein [Patescibacteria group bacterium UBA2163]
MADEQKKSETAKREEEMLAFWNEQNIFEQTLTQTEGGKEFVFYDGPPFATGLPHYGHLLAGTIKDAIPRYKTMRGYHVRRRWGWDTHGLPLENQIEKELGLKNKKDIEELGIETFNEAARSAVLRYADEWKKVVPRFGRWVDMENDYRTMDWTYTESIWWIFAQLRSKGLVYEGFKSMHLCPRCGTTLSNFEVAQGYKDIKDFSVTVKLELVDEPGSYVLAWTTTPWTLPGNMAAAVNNEITYAAVKTDEGIFYVAKERVEDFFEDATIEREVAGSFLVGKKYIPPFNYYTDNALEHKEHAWQIYHADYVTVEDGTGIVHLAPAFGADDLALAQEKNIPIVHHVDKEGVFVSAVSDFAGMQVKPRDDHQATDIEIIKHLAHAGILFKKEKITHSYPHCWRCDTPLLNYATTSWFVETKKIKDALVSENKKINWVPPEVGEKRFGNWLENVRDWSISRARYWGAPIPVWKNTAGDMKVVGSLDDLKKHTKRSGNTYMVMRHGESEKNVSPSIVTDAFDAPYPLTSKGEEDVRRAAQEKLNGVDLIIASPVLRARQTAELVAKELGLSKEQVVFDERVRELEHGVAEGTPYKEFAAKYPISLDRFEHAPEGGENWNDVRRRMGEVLYELEGKYENKKILIISHGDPLALLAAVTQGLDKKETVAHWEACYPVKGEPKEIDFVPLPHNRDYELDFHRPYIDEVQLVDETGESLERVSDVFDCWFESGSMPLAQQHYPFENTDTFEPKTGWFKKTKGYPADFIAEGLDQTRGWFYSLLVLGTGLFGRAPYKNVIVNGTVLAEDGQKMSKKLKNYPDPMEIVDQYGADAVRYYLLSSPAVRAEDFSFTEKSVAEVASKLIGRFTNVLSLYELYREKSMHDAVPHTQHVLDQWIVARLAETETEVRHNMDRYELDRASRPLMSFIDDLSTWYARRSRDRFKEESEDCAAALSTVRFVLRETAKLLAPFTPFIAEYVFQQLRSDADKESVHLTDWPRYSVSEQGVLQKMALVRRHVSDALELRATVGIRVRQPLASVTLRDTTLQGDEAFLELIRDEVNVKAVHFDAAQEEEVVLDTALTPELEEEGAVRELVREVQSLRKKADLEPKDKAVLVVPHDQEDFATKHWDELQSAAGLLRFEVGDTLGVYVE